MLSLDIIKTFLRSAFRSHELIMLPLSLLPLSLLLVTCRAAEHGWFWCQIYGMKCAQIVALVFSPCRCTGAITIIGEVIADFDNLLHADKSVLVIELMLLVSSLRSEFHSSWSRQSDEVCCRNDGRL